MQFPGQQARRVRTRTGRSVDNAQNRKRSNWSEQQTQTAGHHIAVWTIVALIKPNAYVENMMYILFCVKSIFYIQINFLNSSSLSCCSCKCLQSSMIKLKSHKSCVRIVGYLCRHSHLTYKRAPSTELYTNATRNVHRT